MMALDPNEVDPYVLWAEIIRLQNEIKGPDQYETWKDAAVDQKIKRIAAERKVAQLTKDRLSLAPTAFRVDWPVEYSLGMPRFFGGDDQGRMNAWVNNAPSEYRPTVVPLYRKLEE